MKEKIRARARELGFDLCRFTTAAAPDHAQQLEEWLAGGRHGEMEYLRRNAPKRMDPQLVLPGAQSAIVLAVSYFRAEPRPTVKPASHSSGDASGVVARYAQYADYHDILADPLKQLTECVNQLGGPKTRSLWYVDTGPILERDLAQRAGLGFIGKHTSLINRELGNWFFLAEILSTLEIQPDKPERNHCGTCTKCIRACPTGAITAPFQLDARRCISYLTIELKGPIPVEFRRALGNRIYGCDDCLAACPWNRFAREGQLMRKHLRADLDTPELIDLLRLDQAGFKERFKGTPMLRTKRRGLLRNVCVALGNVGDMSALPALARATLDPEPLVAEHARWAIEEIGRRAIQKSSTSPKGSR